MDDRIDSYGNLSDENEKKVRDEVTKAEQLFEEKKMYAAAFFTMISGYMNISEDTDLMVVLIDLGKKAIQQTEDAKDVLGLLFIYNILCVYSNLLGDTKNGDFYKAKYDELMNNPSAFVGSALSEGSLTVVVGVACLAVGFLAAMLIFRKKSSVEGKDA